MAALRTVRGSRSEINQNYDSHHGKWSSGMPFITSAERHLVFGWYIYILHEFFEALPFGLQRWRGIPDCVERDPLPFEFERLF